MIERYRLILKHELIHDDETITLIDHPIIADHLTNYANSYFPSTVIINKMFDELKNELLKQFEG